MSSDPAYSCSNASCPISQSSLPEAADRGLGRRCPACGSTLEAIGIRHGAGEPATVASPAYPVGLEPETMPTYLAHPWLALWTETHPRVRLQWLVDTAEIAVRWAVAVALAEVVFAHGGTIPEEVSHIAAHGSSVSPRPTSIQLHHLSAPPILRNRWKAIVIAY